VLGLLSSPYGVVGRDDQGVYVLVLAGGDVGDMVVGTVLHVLRSGAGFLFLPDSWDMAWPTDSKWTVSAPASASV
jgi:hypothetical protein